MSHFCQYISSCYTAGQIHIHVGNFLLYTVYALNHSHDGENLHFQPIYTKAASAHTSLCMEKLEHSTAAARRKTHFDRKGTLKKHNTRWPSAILTPVLLLNYINICYLESVCALSNVGVQIQIMFQDKINLKVIC